LSIHFRTLSQVPVKDIFVIHIGCLSRFFNENFIYGQKSGQSKKKMSNQEALIFCHFSMILVRKYKI